MGAAGLWGPTGTRTAHSSTPHAPVPSPSFTHSLFWIDAAVNLCMPIPVLLYPGELRRASGRAWVPRMRACVPPHL